jgi:hypothetical protein
MTIRRISRGGNASTGDARRGRRSVSSIACERRRFIAV